MNRRGSLTIEATIGIFVLIILFAFILTVMNALFINEVVNQGLYKTAIEASSSKGTNYTIYQSNVNKGLMINSLKNSIKSDIKYEIYEKLDDSQLNIDYDFYNNKGIIHLQYVFNLVGKPIKVDKEIIFTSFLHKDFSLRTLEDHYVFVTNTGHKYHQEGCFYLRNSQKKITLREAIEQDYTPCSKCYFIGH